jgi:glutamine amidotransferase
VYAHSEENDTQCLGIFDTNVKKFTCDLKIPQVGWNTVEETREPLFKNIPDASYCYFVHSFYAEICNETAAVTEYGTKFSSALQKNNFYGVQFHPEKSAAIGEQILQNFINL